MPGRRSYRENIGGQTWPIRVWIMLALLLVAAMRYATKLYVVQEILVVVLLVAFSTVTILVLAVGFILFQEGIRRAVRWAMTGPTRGTVVYVSGTSRVIKAKDGTLRHFDNVPDSVTVTVDGKQLNIHQIQPGMTIERQTILPRFGAPKT
jgi:hypothetical protein